MTAHGNIKPQSSRASLASKGTKAYIVTPRMDSRAVRDMARVRKPFDVIPSVALVNLCHPPQTALNERSASCHFEHQ
jgi:hypothetical protein